MLNNTLNIVYKNKGSVTVETAVIFPFFIAVIIAFINIIMLISQYETMDHVLNKTCSQMADYAYIYHEKGVSVLGEYLKQKADGNILEAIEKLADKLPLGTENSTWIQSVKNILTGYVNGGIDRADDEIYLPLARALFKANLKKENQAETDEYDLNRSYFFNGNNDINLTLTYKADLIIPFLSDYNITLKQTCVMNAWLSGVGAIKKSSETNIWKLDNFERGRRIRKIFGANLPDNFPVISSFSEGKITIIKSLDFTAISYEYPDELSDRIAGIINIASSYKGQEEPWGKDKVVIKYNEIKIREVILVIPSDTMTEKQNQQFMKAEKIAAGKGVVLNIVRYGYKTG